MRRRISVTRRHVEFLFGPSCKDSPRFLTRFRDVLSGLQFNREERDMNAVPAIQDCACGQDHMVMPTDQEFVDGEWVEHDLVCRVHKRHEPCRTCLRKAGFYDRFNEEGGWLLPPSDESVVGEDD